MTTLRVVESLARMLPLAGSSLPTSPETLAESLRAGLAAHGMRVSEIAAQGAWPQLDSLSLDLSGVPIDAAQSFPRTSGERDGSFSAKQLTIRALPAQFRKAPIDLELSARDAAFAFAPTNGGSVLQLTGAADGHVIVQIALTALEQLIHNFAAESAGEHGVQIKQTRVKLTPRGATGLSVVTEMNAKAFIASTTISISGDLDFDEKFVARISKLRFAGDGMIASIAGGVIRPVLAQMEGKEFPLMSFAVGELNLRAVQIDVGETLSLAAHFGSGSLC